MAVYTEVGDDELAAFLTEYDIGEVISAKGIAEGVENSNYMLLTTRGQYILTLYEKRVEERDLPFFLGLMEHLAAKGFACPTPIPGRDGRALRRLSGRPAAVISFLRGLWPRRILPGHCSGVGRALADLHVAAADFALKRHNALTVDGWRPLLDACRADGDQVARGLIATLDAELALLEARWPTDLPVGVIHADLFPDNVFFLDSELSGVIDFYFACTDFLAYDVAVCLNAWCFESDTSFNVTKARRMLSAYVRRRPLTLAELAAMPLLARGAALRFLLTRLYDWVNTPAGALVKRKDPLEYLRKLNFHAQVTGPEAYGLSAEECCVA